MSELYTLPDGWEWSNFKDSLYLTDFVANGSFASLKENVNYLDKKDYAILVRLKDFSSKWNGDYIYVDKHSYDFLSKSSLNENDIMMCNVGSVGLHFRVPNLGQPMTIGPNSILIRPSVNYLDNSFLYYYFSSNIFKDFLETIIAKTAQPKFNKTGFKTLSIPLPSLEEQKRIVAKLDILFKKIDKAIALHQKNIDEVNVFMASVLNDVFLELEEKYEKKELSNLVSKLGDGLHGTPKYDDNGEYYFINGANVKDNKIIVNQNTKKVNEDEYNKYKKELNDRTIFVSINGTIGNVGLYNNEKCILGKSACYFNLLENIDKIYITYVLKNGDFQEYIEKNSTGATIKNVSLKTMRAYKIPLPPLPTQQKVVAYLDEISNKMEKIKQIQKDKMQSLKELKASILDKAFKGEL